MKNYFGEDKKSIVKGRLICRRTRDRSFGHEFKSDVTKESMKWVDHVKFALQVLSTFFTPYLFPHTYPCPVNTV